MVGVTGSLVARNPVTWLRDVLSIGGSGRPDPPDPGPEREPAGLYECTNCETTYIGVDKRSCPRCDGPVEEIPSEADLGIFQGDD